MSTLSAIQKTLQSQVEAKSVKLEPNSSDTSLIDSREEGVLIAGSNATVSNTNNAGHITIRGGSPNRLGMTGGDVSITSGSGPNFSGASSRSGRVSIQTGSSLAGTSDSGSITLGSGTTVSGDTGSVSIYTGNGSTPSGSGNSGTIDIFSGTGQSTGNVSIFTSDSSSGETNTSGDLKAYTGTTVNGSSGELKLYTGEGTAISEVAFSGGDSGAVSIYSGNTTKGSSGSLSLTTGNATDSSVAGASGEITIATGTVAYNQSPQLNSGEINISTGNGSDSWGASGAVNIFTGTTDSRNSGDVSIYSGSSTQSNSGKVDIYTGSTTANTGRQTGDVWIRTGNNDSSQKTGNIRIYTGNNDDDTGQVGNILIYGGNAPNRTNTNRAGDITISGGKSNNGGLGSSTYGGNVKLEAFGFGTMNYEAYLHSMKSYGAGIQLEVTETSYLNLYNGPDFITQASTPSNRQGWIGLVASHDSGASGDILLWNKDGGWIELETAQGNHTQSGSIRVKTGNAPGNTSGQLFLETGNNVGTSGNSGVSGSVQVKTGSTDGLASGGILIETGLNAGPGGSGGIQIKTGTTAEVLGSGDILLQTGTSTSLQGNKSGNIEFDSQNGEIKAISNLIPDTTSHDQRLLGVQADGVLKALGIKLVATGSVSFTVAGTSFFNDISIVVPGGTISANTKVIHHWEQVGVLNWNTTQEWRVSPTNYGLANHGINNDDIILLYGQGRNNNGQAIDITLNYILYETI